ncbi:MAG: GNAT family N-acetyltransferase [Parasphingopyxis sp.]|nr:GNAT family N-acetyltransferase [Sphingomonadales bacterium]
MNIARNFELPPVAVETVPPPRASIAGALPQRPLRCHFHRIDALPAEIAAQWSLLADEASEPNAFAERWFVEPSLEWLAQKRDMRIAIVMSEDGLLAGMMPIAVKTHYGRIPLRNVQNWKHDNAFLGTPLIRRGIEQGFWAALLEALDRQPWSKGLIHIAGLDRDGPVLAGLHRAARAAGRPCDVVLSTRRALLQSDKSPEAYWAAALRKKKRKEINRLTNRLSEEGQVACSTLGADGDVASWAEAFLALEAKGWKGESGSALACTPKLAAFFRETLARAHAAGRLDFHRLDLDGQPIAMLVNFLTPPGSFSFKIAFDEDYARYSPGVLIQRYNLRILDNPAIAWMDSCAAEDHPMIDGLWSERREIVRVTLPLGGRWNRIVFQACRSAERAAGLVRQLRSRGS